MVLQKSGVIQFSRTRASNKSKAKKFNFTRARVEALRHSGSGPKPESSRHGKAGTRDPSHGERRPHVRVRGTAARQARATAAIQVA